MSNLAVYTITGTNEICSTTRSRLQLLREEHPIQEGFESVCGGGIVIGNKVVNDDCEDACSRIGSELTSVTSAVFKRTAYVIYIR